MHVTTILYTFMTIKNLLPSISHGLQREKSYGVCPNQKAQISLALPKADQE